MRFKLLLIISVMINQIRRFSWRDEIQFQTKDRQGSAGLSAEIELKIDCCLNQFPQIKKRKRAGVALVFFLFVLYVMLIIT